MQNFSGGLNIGGNQSHLWLIYRKMLSCLCEGCRLVCLSKKPNSYVIFESIGGKTLDM